MDNKQKYQQAFCEAFNVEDVESVSHFNYQSVEAWDSIGHLSLITCIEQVFDISLDMDDIIDFESFEAGISILKKYHVEL